MVMMKRPLCASMNANIIGPPVSGRDVVVLAHGYGGDQSIWAKVAPTLAQNHQVLLFDWSFSCAYNKVHDNENDDNNNETSFDVNKYSCSFESFGDDLVSLIDEMGIKSCIFVGHSISCMIGCFASIKRPQLFKKLILIGPSPRYLNDEDYEGGFEHSEIEQLLSTIESNFHNWASSFAPLAVGGKDHNAIEKFEKSLKRMKPEMGLVVAKLIFLSDNRHVLDKVETPCTIISTTNDIVVPTYVPYYMQKKMIKIKSMVEIIDVDGHFPQLTHHYQLLHVLDKVLDTPDLN